MDLEKGRNSGAICAAAPASWRRTGRGGLAGALKAGQAAESAVRYARLGLRVLDLRPQVRAQMRKIGELVYATHSGNPTDSATLQAALEAADQLNEEMEECQRALAALRGSGLRRVRRGEPPATPLCPVRPAAGC